MLSKLKSASAAFIIILGSLANASSEKENRALSQLTQEIDQALYFASLPTETLQEKISLLLRQKKRAETIIKEQIENGIVDASDLSLEESELTTTLKRLEAVTILVEIQIDRRTGRATQESCNRARSLFNLSQMMEDNTVRQTTSLDRKLENLLNLFCVK
jgi:hypothetical protein